VLAFAWVCPSIKAKAALGSLEGPQTLLVIIVISKRNINPQLEVVRLVKQEPPALVITLLNFVGFPVTRAKGPRGLAISERGCTYEIEVPAAMSQCEEL